MQLSSILSPERTFCRAQGGSRKRVFESLAETLSEHHPTLKVHHILDAMMARERLGSTGLGNGIAIPHCRIQACESSIGALISLEQGIDINAPDDKVVDLLFVLMVPAEANDEHLQILAALAKRFNEASYCQGLREARSQEQLYQAAVSLD